MDAVNTAAALLSSPPLAAPCGSQQRFQRPLLPSSLSQLSPREQLMDHEERVGQLERELLDHRANPLPTKAKSALVTCYREKDAYLHFEVIPVVNCNPSLIELTFHLRGPGRKPATRLIWPCAAVFKRPFQVAIPAMPRR